MNTRSNTIQIILLKRMKNWKDTLIIVYALLALSTLGVSNINSTS